MSPGTICTIFLNHPVTALGEAIEWSISISPLTRHSTPAFNPYPNNWPTAPTCSWRDHGIVDQAFITSAGYGSRDINCHVGATAADLYVEIAAGSDMTMQWTPWPTSHKGPVITYLGPCNGDCDKVNLDDIEWTKIEAVGQVVRAKGNGDYGVWAADNLINAGNKWTTKIPASIKAGNYLCRHEIIALLHPSQHYPNCINLKITGSGTDPLSSGTKGVDLYSASQPGIATVAYGNKAYEMPGPPLYAGGSNTGTSSSTDKTTGPSGYAMPSGSPPKGYMTGTKSSYTPVSTDAKPKGYKSTSGYKATDMGTKETTSSEQKKSVMPDPKQYTTPKARYTTTTDTDKDADTDKDVPAGSSPSQLLDMMESVVQALRKAVGNRRRHARSIIS